MGREIEIRLRELLYKSFPILQDAEFENFKVLLRTLRRFEIGV